MPGPSGLLRESYAWITANPLATTHELPDRFVQRWTYEKEDPEEPSGFYFSVFAFGYCQRQLLQRNVPPGVKLKISAEELIEFFQLWQLKLGIIEVHRKTEVRVDAMPLFDFPPNEHIVYSYAKGDKAS